MEEPNQQNEEEKSDGDIDETIEVRRVRETSPVQDQLYGQDLDEDYGEEYQDYQPDQQEDSAASEAPSQWQLESGPGEGAAEGEDQYAPSEASEPATVLTLYYSQQETIISPSDASLLENDSDSEPRPERRFRFTPAKCESMERSRSAPPVPLSEIDEFKGSAQFVQLESVAISANDLSQKGSGKLDLDSTEGHSGCKRFLDGIEALMQSFRISCRQRKYRAKFSQAYKILYKDGFLCYLPEILNSAQEGTLSLFTALGFPYIVVNSEKYIFSPNVLRAGEKLFSAFLKLKDSIHDVYNTYRGRYQEGRMCEETTHANVRRMVSELRGTLEEFDKFWTIFEKAFDCVRVL